MENKHICKLCFRKFANGRALGGHMRSHMMKFYAEEKASKLENGEYEHHDFRSLHSFSSASRRPSSSSSSEEEYDEEEREAVRGALSYELRENPRKSAVLVDHDFSVVDRESETESSKKKSICRRSKRVTKSKFSDLDILIVKKTKFEEERKSNINEQSSPVSSISETTLEEHVAHCLIMLSRDKWEKELRDEEDDDDCDCDDACEDSGVAKMIRNKFRGKYRCEACNQLFRSFQVLGGHKASHKKIKVPAAEEKNGSLKAAEPKVHQCPFCNRIFLSGQALGGHKRSHFVGANAISTNCSTIISQRSRIDQVLTIDLNLRAPVDDEESSQIAISTISNDDKVLAHKEVN